MRLYVYADHAAVRFGQAVGDRARHSAVADVGAVDRGYGADAETGGGDESLVRGVGVVEINVRLVDGYAEFLGEFDGDAAADAGEDVLLPWG